jgi:hypothetical protein
MPFVAMRSSYPGQFDQPSPFSPSTRTPGSDIAVATPSSAASPPNASSSMAPAVREKAAIDRARLFAQGQHNELLMRLNGGERRYDTLTCVRLQRLKFDRQMSEWLYQYWFFCFKTAKHWGKGPTAWTAELLSFDRYTSCTQQSLPGTPQEPLHNTAEDSGSLHTPTDLCRWFIHIRASWPRYEPILDEEVVQPPMGQDPDDESNWVPWPKDQQEPQLSARLRNALEHNDFSPTPTTSLPVAIPVIARAAERSPDELLLEALGFSIMSRNLEQVNATMAKILDLDIEYLSIYPLHMATTYLDGSKTCCDILSLLAKDLDGPQLREFFVNELGHTVWDTLMISIIKSHSSTRPVTVDETWKETKRFPGEETDICGRWDADSPAVRQLLATGSPSTPFEWKHKFCHTSIQAICHCITMMFHINPNPVLHEAPSGLYIRRCFHCGLKLQPQTLHSLVITAYHLANNSCKGEDLFGILACLLCFIACDVDLRKPAVVSVTSLMETDALEGECDHEELTAAGLAEKISSRSNVHAWSETVQSGWVVFCGVLRLSENVYTKAKVEEEDDAMDIASISDEVRDTHERTYCFSHNDPRQDEENVPTCFRMRPDLASLWAATQAELLIHRRLYDHMSWTSTKFSIERLRDQLSRNVPLSAGYLDEALLQSYCPCGRFNGRRLVILSDVIDPDIDTDPNPVTKLIKIDCKDASSRTTYGGLFLEEHDF